MLRVESDSARLLRNRAREVADLMAAGKVDLRLIQERGQVHLITGKTGRCSAVAQWRWSRPNGTRAVEIEVSTVDARQPKVRFGSISKLQSEDELPTEAA